jgi:uncharacterized protein
MSSQIDPPPFTISRPQARRIWLHAQRLDSPAPFGEGLAATPAAVAHLGYVQIDTISVIERCHHHILWTRIPSYRREHLHRAQSIDKNVFEYWTHALSYVPTGDVGVYLNAMRRRRRLEGRFASVTPEVSRKVLKLIRKQGPVTIREIDDDVLVEKQGLWSSRKPSKHALEKAFYDGVLTVSERRGMLRSYELMERHFGWTTRPKPASDAQVLTYLFDRALRSQGIVSLDSICHLDAARKPLMRRLIDRKVRSKQLVPVVLQGQGKTEHWTLPENLETSLDPPQMTHILSPFDPLIIQRKRTHLFFDYLHTFEAYVPKEKRVFGYFTLPVLAGDEFVAAIDLKTDRSKRCVLVQNWTWLKKRRPAALKRTVEEALHAFEAFQLAR